MIQAPSYSDLVAEIKKLKARIAYLERQLYGAKPDRLSRKNKQKADLICHDMPVLWCLGKCKEDDNV